MSWNLLKQSQAGGVVLKIGPFMDTAGAAAAGLSIAQGDVFLSKEGTATYAVKVNSATCTTQGRGMYSCPLDAADIDTLGVLQVSVNKTGAMPYAEKWTVVPANTYDAFILGSQLFDVNMARLTNSAPAATKLNKAATAIAYGTTTVGGGTQIKFTTLDIVEATPDHFKGRTVTFISGALLLQASVITAYQLLSSPTRGEFTVAALTENVPDSTDFVIN